MKLHYSKNAVCAAKGFKAAAVASGLKKSGKLDLALLYSQNPAVACGVFTKNKFPAAPVLICRKHLKAKQAQAIIVNSGNANCFTGKAGLKVGLNTVDKTASLLGLKVTDVLVASTGIIGKQMDFAKINTALPGLTSNLNAAGGSHLAQAIMTTDTTNKEVYTTINIGTKKVTIGGCAKGAGMIAPDMATMLCFITTDASISYPALKKALEGAVEGSFNLISIDGCMSTNDSVIILANGQAQNEMIRLSDSGFAKFALALKEICLVLAKMVVMDAEGISKFIAISVIGAKDNAQAKKCALQIANSNLFKTAMYGENPNFGRIVAAVGASGVQVKEGLKIKCSPLKEKNIKVMVDLMVGKGKATVYTSDLTLEYIRINAEYN